MNNRVINVGEAFPTFQKQAAVSLEKGKEFASLDSSQFKNDEGKWHVMFWWPKDFTFVCPTEIAAFNEKLEDFEDRSHCQYQS
jgi:peroxiredoxin (alkyl hydroperoxide reductase subunit C)